MLSRRLESVKGYCYVNWLRAIYYAALQMSVVTCGRGGGSGLRGGRVFSERIGWKTGPRGHTENAKPKI